MKEWEKYFLVGNKFMWLWVGSWREYGRIDGEVRWISFFRYIYREEIRKDEFFEFWNGCDVYRDDRLVNKYVN